MDRENLINEILKLKEEKDALILAHNYQIPEIQDLADYVGDSLFLSKIAAKTKKNAIVFCGVHFMAESAKILSPSKKVYLPVADAGCPMADMITGDSLSEYRKNNPDRLIVTYVNSSAEVKANSDICCTSSNAFAIIKSLNTDKILFAPDRNLGSYIASKMPHMDIDLWNGFCITHERVNSNEVNLIRSNKPNIEILVHPECNSSIVKLGDFVGSTSQIIEYVRNNDAKEFIISTEMGILHSLRKVAPDKKFHLLSPSLICYNMKKTSLEDVYNVLKNDVNEIKVDEDIRKRAYSSLKKMIDLNE